MKTTKVSIKWLVYGSMVLWAAWIAAWANSFISQNTALIGTGAMITVHGIMLVILIVPTTSCLDRMVREEM